MSSFFVRCFAFLRSTRPSRTSALLVLLLASGLLATSCLTPDFTFPDEDGGTGDGGTEVGSAGNGSTAEGSGGSGLGTSGDGGSPTGGSSPLEDGCLNGHKDGDETDVDCGGSCDACDVVLVNSGTSAHSNHREDTYPLLRIHHVLEHGAADNDFRFVLIAITMQSSSPETPAWVTYDGRAATLLVEATTTQSVSVTLWGLYDAALPNSAGTKTVEVQASNASYGGIAAEVLEFRNVKQYPPDEAALPPFSEGLEAQNCDALGVSTSLTASEGSWLYGMAGTSGSPAAGAEHPAGASSPGGRLVTETLDLVFEGGNTSTRLVTAGAHSGGPVEAGASPSSFTFAVDCYYQGMALLEIEPAP